MKQFLVAIIACSFALSASFAGAAERSGKDIYTAHCAMCHESGVAGAPKAGDQAAWKEHMAEGGLDHMLQVAKKGVGAMPAMGMCNDCTDNELKAAIEFMAKPAK